MHLDWLPGHTGALLIPGDHSDKPGGVGSLPGNLVGDCNVCGCQCGLVSVK